MLRGSLCRVGPKAQGRHLWKPRRLQTKFWMHPINTRQCAGSVRAENKIRIVLWCAFSRDRNAQGFQERFRDAAERTSQNVPCSAPCRIRPRLGPALRLQDLDAVAARARALRISIARWRRLSNSHGSTRTRESASSGRSCEEAGLLSRGFVALSFSSMVFGSPRIAVPWKVVSKFAK